MNESMVPPPVSPSQKAGSAADDVLQVAATSLSPTGNVDGSAAASPLVGGTSPPSGVLHPSAGIGSLPGNMASTPVTRSRMVWEGLRLEGEAFMSNADQWKKNEGKTAYCDTCGLRVKKWAWQCVKPGCGTRICSACLTPDGESSEYAQKKARYQLAEGCWHGKAPNVVHQNAPGRAVMLEQMKKAAEDREAAAKTTNGKEVDKTKGKRKRSNVDYSDTQFDDENSSTGHTGKKAKKASTVSKAASNNFDDVDDDDDDNDDYRELKVGEATAQRTNNKRNRGKVDYSDALEDENSDGEFGYGPSMVRASKKAKRAAQMALNGTDEDTEDDNNDKPTNRRKIVSLPVDPEKLRDVLTKPNVPTKPSTKAPVKPKAPIKSKTPVKLASTKSNPVKQVRFSGLVDPDRKPVPVGPHLEGKCTVIVGAGVIGLFIARELARFVDRQKASHYIVVVDMESGPFEMSSGKCNGFLTTSGMPEEWAEFAADARALWSEDIKDQNIRSSLNPKTDTLFDILEGDDNDQTTRPTWLDSNGELVTLQADEEGFGRIDPTKLANRLRHECQKRGVQFHFDTEVSGLAMSVQGELRGVLIKSTAAEKKMPESSMDAQADGENVAQSSTSPEPGRKISCHNLVLAAGPYTTNTLSTLIGEVPTTLSNFVQAVDWVDIDHFPDATGVDDIGLRLPNAAKEMDEITMVAKPVAGSIMVAGYSKFDSKHLDISAPRTTTTTLVKQLASTYLRKDATEFNMDLRAEGRSELSLGRNNSPVIDRIPTPVLQGRMEDESGDERMGGLWLCYGFGGYGTTLAPAAAYKLVSRIAKGCKANDDETFSIPSFSNMGSSQKE